MNRSRLPCFFSVPAKDDLNREISYLLETAGETIALRFLTAAEETLNLIAEFPHLGTSCFTLTPPASSLRWRPFAGRFSSWLVFYSIMPEHIEITRILRGERDWQSLLQ